MSQRVTRGLESREVARVTLELTHVMTLACLHSAFSYVSLFPLGLHVICVLVPLR